MWNSAILFTGRPRRSSRSDAKHLQITFAQIWAKVSACDFQELLKDFQGFHHQCIGKYQYCGLIHGYRGGGGVQLNEVDGLKRTVDKASEGIKGYKESLCRDGDEACVSVYSLESTHGTERKDKDDSLSIYLVFS